MFEQERLIGRLQRSVLAEPDITACFLSGSFGRRSADPYSDLDIVLVHRDKKALGRAWLSRIQFAKSIMPYISFKSFDGEHIRPFFHIVLFANGSKVDLRYETQDSLTPNPYDSQIRILKDTDGWAETYQSKSGQQPLPQASMNNHDMKAIDQRFWVMFWDVLRLLARGDTDKSFPIYLELLHFTFPPLLDALPPEIPARKNLFEAHFSRDAAITAGHLISLLNAYIGARKAVVERYHLQSSTDQPFENQIQRLIERLT